MRKIFTLILSALILITCAACGNVDKKTSAEKITANEGQAEILNLTTKKVKLNSGYEMPVIGLGTYALDYDTCVNSVMALIKNGGRLIDTAYMYGNEDAVGEGVRRAMKEYGVPREEIFVITKIYPNQFSNPDAAIEMALEKLNIGYIDMMLLHHPGTDDVKAYKAMEKYVAAGKIRSLGLSNSHDKAGAGTKRNSSLLSRKRRGAFHSVKKYRGAELVSVGRSRLYKITARRRKNYSYS